MVSKSKTKIELSKKMNIISLKEYIFYFENLDSKDLINKIYENEKILNNFHIKINDEADLEALRFILLSLKIILDLLDSLNESEKNLINWKDILNFLIFEKMSMNLILKNTIREIKRRDSFTIHNAIKNLLHNRKELNNRRYNQKTITEFL